MMRHDVIRQRSRDSVRRVHVGPLAAILACICLSACQGSGPQVAAPSGKSAALAMMEAVAITAQKCWFASRDPAFAAYRMANELNSFSGRPRILLVPARRPEANPLLVVQAEGSPARLQAFGPLMDGEHAARIASDVRRWSAGDGACSTRA